ncbi:MAG: cache domain-containing protein [bacterium]
MKKRSVINRKKYFLNIIVPTLLTQCLFIVLIFAVIIPYFNHYLIEAKKEMIKEVVNTSICIADKNYADAVSGIVSFEEAKKRTISTMSVVRYGTKNKDYIWITDEIPTMIMHPYRKELVGKNVENFTDPNGKKMFLEMVNTVKKKGNGFVYYMWQWMDDSSRVVPKISYVKEYKEWHWIIGTGVYIEDVRNSISIVINSMIFISLGIFSIVSFLLVFIAKQNLKVERQRNKAEQDLKESHEKYKALVEASNDGALMFVDNKCVFGNNIINELLHFKALDEIKPNLENIIDPELKEDLEQINSFLIGIEESFQIETVIKDKFNNPLSVLLAFSKISLSKLEGFIIIVKDLSSNLKEAELNLFMSDIVLNISAKLNIGIFRALPGNKGKMVEVNKYFLNLLGYNSLTEILGVPLLDLFADSGEKKEFISLLNINGFIKEYLCKARKKDGTIINLILSVVIVKDKYGVVEFVDGLLMDYSHQKIMDEQKEQLLNSFINDSLIWDLPVTALPTKDIIECQPNITISKALELMDFYSTDILISKIFPNSENEKYSSEIFIVSKEKIFSKITIPNFDLNMPVSLCFEVPDQKVHLKSTAIQCILNMLRTNKNYVLIEIDGELKIIGIADIMSLLNSNIRFLTERLHQAKSLDELKNIHYKLPLFIRNLVHVGADIGVITNTITDVSDIISKSVIEEAINQIGAPPCKFSFIALGSEGRSEQGLSTDQDNAIIFEDNVEYLPDSFEKNKTEIEHQNKYFINLALLINKLLNQVGYKLCVGEIMAMNPKWNKPISIWKHYFWDWITTPEPQSLIDSSIFFDFRHIYGESSLAQQLKQHVNITIKENPAFLGQVALMTANYKLPVGKFGKIQTETIEDHQDSFNLKNAIRLLVNIVRLYTMKHSIDETNTLTRLELLYNKNYIPESFYTEMKFCFKYLLKLQFQYQVDNYMRGVEADNYLYLTSLTPTELSNLKSVLTAISSFQSKVKFDFGINV